MSPIVPDEVRHTLLGQTRYPALAFDKPVEATKGQKFGLALVLVFVGLKMSWLNAAFGGKFPIGLSLGIIFGILVVSMAASWLIPPKPATTR